MRLWRGCACTVHVQDGLLRCGVLLAAEVGLELRVFPVDVVALLRRAGDLMREAGGDGEAVDEYGDVIDDVVPSRRRQRGPRKPDARRKAGG